MRVRFPLFCCARVCMKGWGIHVGRGLADIKLKLANSTESELRTLQSSLQSQKDDVAVDLQRNVFKKYGLLYYRTDRVILTLFSKLCGIYACVEGGQHLGE